MAQKRAPLRKRSFDREPHKRSNRYELSADAKIDYKNVALLQKFVTDSGKLVARRISGVSGKQQRQFSIAVKRARYLGLLSVGSTKKRM